MTDSVPPVPLFKLFWKLGGFIPLFMIGIWSVSLIVSIFVILEERQTNGKMKPSQATVLSHVVSETEEAGLREVISHTYNLELRFQLQTGNEVRIYHPVGGLEFDRIKDGDVIPVWYSEDNPRLIELTEGERGKAAKVLIWVNSGIFLLVVLCCLPALSKTRAALRARRRGDWQVVKVTDWKKSLTSSPVEQEYRLCWQGPDGQVFRSFPRGESVLKPYRKGKKIDVVFEGKRSWWVQDIGQEF
ncbi:DUF3592 domain-containing protein [Tropicibacter sp. R15_0]|uniref:DUF3592 domain-containing protein n=1 Tax=Tropicibacter sp. R15_0 TaxID=2821101 RepID=UPI001ADCA58B|nr:DUF3592 domain-containing protein [Tropicibacter sp. R15_0]MBO9464918.1 DUF3592 domain-containing protein [Tropicibacter sp. R15_0]